MDKILNDPADIEAEFESGKEEGIAAERAAIVAWLQKLAEDYDAVAPSGRSGVVCRVAAHAIERGDHVKPRTLGVK